VKPGPDRKSRGFCLVVVIFSPDFADLTILIFIGEFTYGQEGMGILRPGRGGQPPGAKMSQLLVRFGKDQSGATAIEYGLIAAGIAVAIIAVVNGLGTQLNTTFSSISTQLK
jgi:pilus assembly protein Flp/PilA